MKVKKPKKEQCEICYFLEYRLMGGVTGKLLCSLLLLISVIAMVVDLILNENINYHVVEILLLFASSHILLLDFVITVFFFVSDTVKYLRVYNIYATLMLCLLVLYMAASTACSLHYISVYPEPGPKSLRIVASLAHPRYLFGLFTLLLQIYVMVLTRISKRKNCTECLFLNIPVAAEVKNGSNDQTKAIEINRQLIEIIDPTKGTDLGKF